MTLSKKEFKSKETWRILKNAVMMSIAFMIHFTAYSGTANLQSSINAEAGLGTASLAAVYAGFIISNMFLPVIIIKWLGTKWAIALSFITYMPYIAAQLYPRFYTLIPAGFIMGMGGGPLWCAKSTYLSIASEAHRQISNISAEVLLVRYFGLFFMIYQLNQVWGNLISSLVLTSGDNLAAVTAVNDSMISKLCGANFIPTTDAGVVLQKQPPEKIQLIVGIFLGCTALASLIVVIGVDSMKRSTSKSGENRSNSNGLQLISATLKVLIEPKQLMLISINVFVGMQQAFFGADFTAAFVSCSVGIGSVGFVMLGYGLADAIGSVVVGQLAKKVGRLPLMIVAYITHTLLMVTLFTWSPQSHQSYIMYIIAVLWGLCDSIWVVQISAPAWKVICHRLELACLLLLLVLFWQRALHTQSALCSRYPEFSKSLYGMLFLGREEAAFSNVRFSESIGYIVAYLISTHLQTRIKTYILLATMSIGMVFYLIIEYRERRVKNKHTDLDKTENENAN